MAMPVYENDDGLNRHFTHFLGQTVAVCVEGGGACGRCFSGVLAAVYGDHIRLLNFVEPLPVRRRFRIAVRYRNVIGCRPFRPCFNGFGVITCIPVKKIVAFSHSTVPFLAPDLGTEQQHRPERSPSIMSLFIFVLLVMLLMRINRHAGEHEEPGYLCISLTFWDGQALSNQSKAQRLLFIRSRTCRQEKEEGGR